MPGLRIQVYEKQHLVHSVECPGAVELGRQAEGEAGPYLTQQEGDRRRVVVARLDEILVSRRWLVAEPLAAGRARIANVSRGLPVPFLDGSQLDAGASRVIALPAFVVVGERRIGIHEADTPTVLPTTAPSTAARATTKAVAPHGPASQPLESGLGTSMHTLAQATIPPGAGLTIGHPRLTPPSTAPGDPSDETTIRWLQAAMDVLQSAATSSEFFDKAASALVELVGLDSGQVLLFQDGGWQSQAHRVGTHHRPEDERPASGKVLGRVLAEKRTFWQTPADTAPEGSLVGVNAVVAAPILRKDGAVIGALYGNRRARGPGAGLSPITKLEALLVELLAGGVAAGVARIEHEQAHQERQKKFLLYERELAIGRKIQLGFLPEVLPRPAGWEVMAHFQPARDVAGDFYDMFPLSTNHVALVMADVCDKGVGAALFMALFRSLIRAFFMQTPLVPFMGTKGREDLAGSDPTLSLANRRRGGLIGDLVTLLTVEHTNRYVATTHAEACMFVTLFLAVLDTSSGELAYVNAGHDSPTIIGPNGIRARLEPTGPVVGLMADAAFDLSKTRLEPGETLLAHTDGVTDARDPAGKSFSEGRFLAILKAGAPSAASLVGRLVSDLNAHIAGADQFDDITLMAIRRESEPSSSTPRVVASIASPHR
jgi:phosphoserine phosphatase RsbU/P